MKTAYMALLIGVLMLSPSEAREEFMSKRASALMSALNVEAASDEIFSPRHGNDLTALKHTKTGNLTVRRWQKEEGNDNNQDEELTFLNDKDVVEAFGRVKYRMTPRAAQSALFEELAMNSLPMPLLLERYEVDKKGPGDLCIIDKLKERVHFIRANVTVSIRSIDTRVETMKLAQELDQILVGENE
ncbi:MAG: hypothetical protein WAQ74_06630 [Kiritimatiellia bacterium]|jgi:hypothetical protein